MERVQRMKTATSQQDPLASPALVPAVSRAQLKPLAAFTAAAALTLGIGLAVPFGAAAQETTPRTLATGSGIPLSAEAPDRYTVKAGDTLWDISKVFLRDPWYWPEIWYVNPQIKNPHLIYPGDTLALVSLNGRPQVSVAERGPVGTAADAAPDADAGPTRSGNATRLSPQIHSKEITEAITAIPYSAIAAFVSRPGILTKGQIESLPYLVGMRDSHLAGGIDNDVYAQRLSGASDGDRYNIFHVDIPLRDPETDKVLGYRAIYVGTGAVTAAGSTAKLRIESAEREALRGDKLFAEDLSLPLDFLPHPVDDSMRGSIIAVDGVSIAGRQNVVAINRGTRQGIEPGHVFAVAQKGETVVDTFSHGGTNSTGNYWQMGGKKVKLPDERVGVVMIFKVEDRMSYGLIMESTHPVRAGDFVVAP
jgi:hypothetical protein